MCPRMRGASVQMDALMKLREQMNAGLGGGGGGGKDKSAPAPKISVNDFVVKAAAKALKQVPGEGLVNQAALTHPVGHVARAYANGIRVESHGSSEAVQLAVAPSRTGGHRGGPHI